MKNPQMTDKDLENYLKMIHRQQDHYSVSGDLAEKNVKELDNMARFAIIKRHNPNIENYESNNY